MKYIFLLLIALNLLINNSAYATTGLGGEEVNKIEFSEEVGGNALTNLVENIIQMTEDINTASSEMMKIADMIICNSYHGKGADWKIKVFFVTIWKVKVLNIPIWVSGYILYLIGILISLSASFYMFDIALNLSISILLLPIALALWPFAWTKKHLKTVIESIIYYVGLFIFLPLGILLARSLITYVADSAFADSGFDFATAMAEDKTDLINDNLGVASLTFLKLLITYILAFKIIPLLANEFCGHFFSEGLIKTPMSDKMQQALNKLNDKTIKKMGKYGKDVLKHQTGKAIENKLGNSKGNLLERGLANFGKEFSKTKK